MAAQDRDFIVWRRANDLLEQAERIHRNFLQVDTGALPGTARQKTKLGASG